jgi:hypothetical protein
MIPEGSWKAKGGAWAIGTASTGTDQVGVEIIFLEGPAKDERRTWYGYFTDAAFERTIESLRLLGWKGSDLSDLTGIGTTEVYAVVAHEQDQHGEIRERVAWINDLGGVAMSNRMDEGSAKAFAARMRGKILALDAAGGRKPGAPAMRQASLPSREPPPTGAGGASHVMPPPEDDNTPF